MQIEARKNERGAWCVYVDGRMVSDHVTHTAARIAAQQLVEIQRRGAP